MSNGQKALLAALAGVVVLFVFAVIAGGGAGEGEPDADQDGIIGALLDRFGDPAAAGPAELSGACLRPDGTVLVQGSCSVRVAPSDQRMRLVEFRALQPVVVAARAPEDAGFTVRKAVDAGEEVGVAVDSSGGSITLSCGFGSCGLVLLDGSSR